MESTQACNWCMRAWQTDSQDPEWWPKCRRPASKWYVTVHRARGVARPTPFWR